MGSSALHSPHKEAPPAASPPAGRRPALKRALLCLLVIAMIATPCPTRPAVAQRGLMGRISRVIPFAGVVVGWRHRNRVYRNAENFIRDRKQYYDSLQDTAGKQLVSGQQLGLRKSQLAAYAKVTALIEQRRKTELDVAESRKRQARAEFHGRVEDALIYALAGNRVVREVIDALRNGVNSAQQVLDRALGKITSGASGTLGDINRVRDISRQLSDVGKVVGGEAGRRLAGFSDRIVRTIDQGQAATRDLIQKMQNELRSLDQILQALKDVGRTPTAGEVVEHIVARFLPGNGQSDNASVEAVAAILSKLEVGDGSLKDQAQKALNAGFVARCAELAAAYKAQLEALKKSGDEDASTPPAGPGCRAVTGADLLKELDELIAEKPPESEEPQEPEVLPLVAASGQYSESVSGGAGPAPPMGTSFRLTADFAAGTITFSLSGGRTVAGVRESCVGEDQSVEIDAILVDYIEAYTAEASGSLEVETGEFSVPFTPSGATTDRKTTLFTDEGCAPLNSVPAPGSHTYAGTEGLLAGYVTRDGAIEFSTSWSHCGSAHMQGGWSGYGSVTDR